MPQQQGLQDQINQTLPVIRGFAEPLIFVHQWDFPRLDTQYSNPHKETNRGEEADFLVEEEADFTVEEEVDLQEEDSQVVEDLYKVTLTEDHQETDW